MCTEDHSSRPLPHRHSQLPVRRGACVYCQRQSTGTAARPRLAREAAILFLGNVLALPVEWVAGGIVQDASELAVAVGC